jgi:hypothetical protein
VIPINELQTIEEKDVDVDAGWDEPSNNAHICFAIVFLGTCGLVVAGTVWFFLR